MLHLLDGSTFYFEVDVQYARQRMKPRFVLSAMVLLLFVGFPMTGHHTSISLDKQTESNAGVLAPPSFSPGAPAGCYPRTACTDATPTNSSFRLATARAAAFMLA